MTQCAPKSEFEPIMQQDHAFSSQVLRQGTRALAAYAATDLLEGHPEAKEGIDDDPFAKWQVWLVNRIDELAAALAAGRPTLFAEQVQWAAAVATARGISPDAFAPACNASNESSPKSFPARSGDGDRVC